MRINPSTHSLISYSILGGQVGWNFIIMCPFPERWHRQIFDHKWLFIIKDNQTFRRKRTAKADDDHVN